jgi:8-oxo-dGTP diphosphatase
MAEGCQEKLFLMKSIPVACAIIKKDGKILATQRSKSMRMPLKWEFPGGKIDKGESPAQCLKRELLEDLGVNVEVGPSLPKITHAYPTFFITLFPFFCTIIEGEITLHEHTAMQWLLPTELKIPDWTEADLELILKCERLLMH